MPSESHWFETIGRATHAAEVIDLIVMNAFRVASGFTSAQAQAIYYSPDAFQTRVKLIKNLLKTSHTPIRPGMLGDPYEMVMSIIEFAKTAHKRRNELAHSFLTNDAGGLNRVHMKQMGQPKTLLTDAYLASALIPITQSLEQATRRYEQLCGLLGVPPELWS